MCDGKPQDDADRHGRRFRGKGRGRAIHGATAGGVGAVLERLQQGEDFLQCYVSHLRQIR